METMTIGQHWWRDGMTAAASGCHQLRGGSSSLMAPGISARSSLQTCLRGEATSSAHEIWNYLSMTISAVQHIDAVT